MLYILYMSQRSCVLIWFVDAMLRFVNQQISAVIVRSPVLNAIEWHGWGQDYIGGLIIFTSILLSVTPNLIHIGGYSKH